MYIEVASAVTEELHRSLQRLIPQLTTNNTAPGWEELASLIDSKSSTLLLARHPGENGEIVGILTLTIYRVPTGIRSIIEDVIVDENLRRQGIGAALLSQAIELARREGANSITLTSNPRREAANLLYQSMGFKRRETNAYYLNLK
ncbi:MAG TPA: GNAT family N-acetyltransferase [Anaerolineales bacterium]|nr:GNAT family N-acetyltransferase [Anaerolineales bacterium]